MGWWGEEVGGRGLFFEEDDVVMKEKKKAWHQEPGAFSMMFVFGRRQAWDCSASISVVSFWLYSPSRHSRVKESKSKVQKQPAEILFSTMMYKDTIPQQIVTHQSSFSETH